MAFFRKQRLSPRLLWLGTVVLVPLTMLGIWVVLFPPPPSLAKEAGVPGELYAPDVIGLDRAGRVSANGKPYAEPSAGRFDEEAVLEIARSRWRLRKKDPFDPIDLLEWQVLRLDSDVPMREADELVGLLRQHGIPRICFDASVLDPEAPPRLLHAWRREMLGTSCGADWGFDETFLIITVLDEWEDAAFQWGHSGSAELHTGDLADLRIAAGAQVLESATIDARPEAAWGDVLAALCILDDEGFPLQFPFLQEEDV